MKRLPLLICTACLVAGTATLFIVQSKKKNDSLSLRQAENPVLEVSGPFIPTPPPTPVPTPSPKPTENPVAALAPTIHMSFEELIGDNGDYNLPVGYPASDTYRIIVDICNQVVIVYTRDSDGDYTVPVRYMLCSTGTGSSTPRGSFEMKRYRVRFGFFQNDKTYGQYWTLINGRIYFHTTLYAERDASSYIGETYDALGSPASHGCIRLTVPDARFIYYNCAHGTIVEIRNGDESDKETAAIREQLVLAKRPSEQVSINPGNIPDTDNWHIQDVSHIVPYEPGSQKNQR